MAAPCTSEAPALLRAVALTLGRSGCSEPILEDVHLALAPGECVVLEGATGSGKTTLLRALAGLRGAETLTGAIERRTVPRLLMQQVEPQLLCTTVEEEVGLGLRARELEGEAVAERVARELARVGLAGRERCEVDALSAGEKQRVVLAALLALEPRVLLLDEPCSALDPAARRSLAAALARLKRSGTALLVAEHVGDELRAIADRQLAVVAGRLHDRTLSAAGPMPSPALPSGPPMHGAHRSSPPVEVRTLTGGMVEDPNALGALAAGQRVLLTGPNGAGKSTCLRALATRLAGRAGEVALVIQDPRRSVFARTVAEEAAFALRRRRVASRERRGRVEQLLERFELMELAERSPLTLSFGQQHRLAIAAALAASPRLVLLDEPFAGLDPGGRDSLLRILAQEQAESKASIVVASHDDHPLSDWCDRVIQLRTEDPRSPKGSRAPAVWSRPFQFRVGDSVLHRLGAGWKLAMAGAIGAAAIGTGDLHWLAAMLSLVVGGYALARLRWSQLWKDVRWLLLNAVLVVTFTVGLRGVGALSAGCRTALQLLLFFLPLALMLRTTPSESLLGPLRRRLPDRLGFALGATLRLVPVFVREGGELVDMQRLRGARLHPRELWHPGAWKDWLACVVLPMTVRAIEVAEAAAEAALMRGVGVTEGRYGSREEWS